MSRGGSPPTHSSRVQNYQQAEVKQSANEKDVFLKRRNLSRLPIDISPSKIYWRSSMKQDLSFAYIPLKGGQARQTLAHLGPKSG